MVTKCGPLPQRGPELAVITFNENAKDPVISQFQTTTVSTEQNALDQLTSVEDKPNKSVSSSSTSSWKAVKASTGIIRLQRLTVGHLNQWDKQKYMITRVVFYTVSIKSIGIWTLNFIMTEFENRNISPDKQIWKLFGNYKTVLVVND